jgi:organic radical activating enzyme
MFYPIHETFHSWQGEGVHLGRSAFFIRLFGCPVKCPWCDSAGTWHHAYIPKRIEKRSASELTEAAAYAGAEFVVVTGGEPAIHDLRPLTNGLRERGIPVHLETSGAFEIKGAFDWITLSPKWQRLPLAENLGLADELKLIVEDEQSIEKWIQELGDRIDKAPVWLHPEWSQHEDSGVLQSITSIVKNRGAPFRAGLQAHKFFKADLLDPNSSKPSPLGGNLDLGY